MKNRVYYIFLLFFLISFGINAQFYSYLNDTVGSPNKIVIDKSNNLIYCAGIDLVKMTPDNANVIWSKKVDTTYTDWFSSLGIVGVDTNDNIITTMLVSNSGKNYYILKKTDLNGIPIWSKKLSFNVGNMTLNSSYLSKDNSIYVAGGNCGEMNFIIKINTLGNIIWAKRYYNVFPSTAGYISTLTEDLIGNLVITSNSAYTYTTPYRMNPVFKIDKNGNVLWDKFYQFDSVSTVFPFGIAVNSTKEIIIGFTYNRSSGYQNQVMKLDSSGNLIWMNRYKLPGGQNMLGSGLVLDKNDNIIYATTYYDSVSVCAHAALLKINGITGNSITAMKNDTLNISAIYSINQSTIIIGGSKSIGSGQSFLTSVDDNLNGSCLFTPTSFSVASFSLATLPFSFTSTVITPKDSLLAENLLPIGLTRTNLCSVLGVSEKNVLTLKLFPNPASANLYIENSDGLELQKIIISDVLGKELLNLNPERKDSEIDIRFLQPGFYQIQLIDKNGLTFTRKFVKE